MKFVLSSFFFRNFFSTIYLAKTKPKDKKKSCLLYNKIMYMLCQSSSFAKVLLLQSRALAKVLLLQRTSCQSSFFFAKVLKTLAGFLLKYKNHIIIKIFINKLIKNGISPRSCGHNS